MAWRPGVVVGLIALSLLVCLALGCADDNEETGGADGDDFPTQVVDAPFRQEMRVELLRADVEGFFSLLPQPPNRIHAIARDGGAVYAGTDFGLTVYQGGLWTTPITGRPVYSILVDDHLVHLGSTGAVLTLDGTFIITIPLPDAGKVRALATHAGRLYAGCEDGLFVLDTEFSPVPDLAGIYIFDLATAPDGSLWAATGEGLFHLKNGVVERQWTVADYLLSRNVRGVAFADDGAVWIATDRGVNVLHADGAMDAITSGQGLPITKVTTVKIVADGPLAGVWLGTARGLVRFATDRWHYYAGRRWLPHDGVTAVATDTDGIWVATENGASFLEARSLTLAAKAAHYLDITVRRHNRLGLVAACDLDVPGDLSTFRRLQTPTDAFSTGLHLAALSFQYAVTGDPKIRTQANEHFAALSFLETVTPVPGLPARSIDRLYTRSANPNCTPFCDWQANADLGFDWLSDTDTQTVMAYFFAFAVYYDLAADQPHRQEAAAVVARIADHLLDHDLFLYDWDGEPTTWGVWNPATLWQWYRERNPFAALRKYGQVLPNSLQILMFMKAAHHMTGAARFATAYNTLIRDHALDNLIVNATVEMPIFTNHNTDQLVFLTHYPLLQYETDESLRDKYLYSLARAFAVNRVEQNSLFDFIHGALTEGTVDFDAVAAVETLRQTPLDLVDWRLENSHRADVTIDPLPNRNGERLSDVTLPPLPPDERALTLWNGDPFVLDGGGDGANEKAGSFWLLAYWLARYHEIVID